SAICSSDYRCSRLVFLFCPRTNLKIRTQSNAVGKCRGNLSGHENSRVPAEPLLLKWTHHFSRLMRQQLGFDTLNSRRLLEGLDDMGKQFLFDFVSIGSATPIPDKQVADHSLALFVNEKRVAENVATLDRGITGQNFGVEVAENHFRRTGVVPREK